MKKNLKRVINTVEEIAPGAEIVKTHSGHYRITHPTFLTPIFMGSTPSDNRAWKNFIAHLRRAVRESDNA